MRVLILQFVTPSAVGVLPEFRQDLGVAVALLRRAGLDVSLAAIGVYQADAVRQAVNRHRPSHLVAEAPSVRSSAARHAVIDVHSRYCLPTVMVGPYATTSPQQALSIPGVWAVLAGEYELALARMFESIADGQGPDAQCPGVWINSDDGILRGPAPRPVADLDGLPYPDREVFQTARTIAATGAVEFSASRGCPGSCAFCTNDKERRMSPDPGRYPRRRSPANVIGEIAQVLARYQGVRRLRFIDHAFAADPAWLEAFAAEYQRTACLPFRCRVRCGTMDPRVPDLLARAGCEWVDMEIGSGSAFIREEVLDLPGTRAQLVEALAALRSAGLKISGRVFVGAPYESDLSVEETLDLLAEIQLDEVRPRAFYPMPGTRAAEVCAENAWTSGRGEENFLAGRSVLDMPALSGGRIDEIARKFTALLKRRARPSLGALLFGRRHGRAD